MTLPVANKYRAGMMGARHAELVEKITAFIETLIDDPDASTALTTLGFSAFIKTLIDDPDAATARATLGAFASAGGTVSGPMQQTVTTLTASSNTFTPDCSLSNEFECVTTAGGTAITANSTIANPTNVPAAGKVQPLSIKWTQDGTGGRTMSFGANCINVGGNLANTAAGKTNFAVGKVYSDGKFYYSIVRGV